MREQALCSGKMYRLLPGKGLKGYDYELRKSMLCSYRSGSNEMKSMMYVGRGATSLRSFVPQI